MKRAFAIELCVATALLVACADHTPERARDGGLSEDASASIARPGEDGSVVHEVPSAPSGRDPGVATGDAGSVDVADAQAPDDATTPPTGSDVDAGGADAGSGGSLDDAGSPADGGPGGGGGAQDAATTDSGPVVVGSDAGVLCGDHVCACANGSDDDGDGRSDLGDPECISTWDDDEDTFATGMPGDNRDDACQDCFFDGNSGSGNDGCRTPTSCLLTGTASSGQGSCSSCEQTQRCVDYCRAFTPNGCDCFGCCDVRINATDVRHVLIGSGCDLEGSTLVGCTECVPNPTCNNACGRCELCPGKTEADLPADCTAGGSPDGGISTEPPGHTCDDGDAPCGEGYDLCPSGSLCQFGCCVLTPA